MRIPANSLSVEARVDLKEELREAGSSPVEAAVVIASRIPISSQPHDRIVNRVRDWSHQIDDTHPLVHSALRELGFQMSTGSYSKAYERSGKDAEWLIGREHSAYPKDTTNDDTESDR